MTKKEKIYGKYCLFQSSFNSSGISSPSGSVNSPFLDDQSGVKLYAFLLSLQYPKCFFDFQAGGVRRGSSGSAFSHNKGSRAHSREDLNSSPSRSFDQKHTESSGSFELKRK